MKCIQCGNELPEGSKFCFNCGAQQPEQPIVDEEINTVPEDIYNDMEKTVFLGNIHDEKFYGKDQFEDEIYESEEEPVLDYDTSQKIYEFEDKVVEEDVQGNACFCPFCGTENDADATFCAQCGKSITEDAGMYNAEQGSKKKLGKIPVVIGGVAAAAVVVFAGVKIIGGIFGGSSDVDVQYVNYIKDGGLNSIDLDSRKKEPVSYRGDMDDYWYMDAITYSEDGKYMYYPSDYDDDDEVFRLNVVKVGKEAEDVIKIDNDVAVYYVLESGTDVLYRKDDTLYKNDIKGNKEKIASDVDYVFWDENEKYVMWAEKDGEDERLTLYYRDLKLKNDKKKLVSDVFVEDFTSDLQKIVVSDEDTLYLIENFGDKEKIDSDVSDYSGMSDDGDTIYYTKSEDDELTAADLVNDDMADSDAAMKEPKREDFTEEKVEKNEYTDRYEKKEVLDSEAYDAAWDKYEAKEDRDDMRERLKETVITNTISSLCKYEDGKTEVIEESVSSVITQNDTLITYNRIDMADMPKVKLSEVEHVSDVESKYYEKLTESAISCVYNDGKKFDLDENIVNSVWIDWDAKKAYTILLEDRRLVSFSIEKEGKFEEIETDVNYIEGLFNGDIYYLVDVKDNEGDLYCNDKLVDSDVYYYSVGQIKDSGTVYYATDLNEAKVRFTLKTFNGKKSEKIADDVAMFKFNSEKEAVLLTDYSTSRETGDLRLYTGKDELQDLDDDVEYIVGGVAPY